MKDKEYHVVIFATFVSKTLIFSSQNMDELNFKPAQYCINLNWPSPVFGWFQNGCNKVVIEPPVVQFKSEIILVITNQTCAACSFDFEITHMICAQIALHSVQLPLSIEFMAIRQACTVFYVYKSKSVYMYLIQKGYYEQNGTHTLLATYVLLQKEILNK